MKVVASIVFLLILLVGSSMWAQTPGTDAEPARLKQTALDCIEGGYKASAKGIDGAPVFLASGRGAEMQQSQLAGRWIGGFRLHGNWTSVMLRFNPNETPAATADVFFPSYSASRRATNVVLMNFSQSRENLHFEIPFESERVIFEGRHDARTIFGTFVYNGARGPFGLTRVERLELETLEKYYGAYRVSPHRVISIFRGWDNARTLNYVDYQTGQVGTLWSTSETEFISGSGLAVSFPVTLKVSFALDASGRATSLSWQSISNRRLTARRMEFDETRITFKNGDITLAGTLISPGTRGRHPAVIVVPGDYGTHRNQLRMWAHNFASRGIAALVFDARGGGESTGAVGSSSFPDLANDVIAGVQSLQTRPDVNPKQIGLFGFSNSAFTVSLAASRSRDVAFVIMQSFVGVPGWEQESYRVETQLRVDDFPASIVKDGADFMRLKWEAARTGRGWNQIERIMERARDEQWLVYTNPPSSLERLQRRWPDMVYDPIPALAGITVPILSFWGDKDTFLPVPVTVTNFKRAMGKAGNRNYTALVFHNASHSMLRTKTGSSNTGGTETHFVPGLWTMQTNWVLSQARTTLKE